MGESRTMFGVCEDCGTKLKYEEVPEGFLYGAVMAVASTPFIFFALFDWVLLLQMGAFIALLSYGVYYMTKKFGGVTYHYSLKEFEKNNIFLKFLSFLVGATVVFFFSMLLLKLSV
ncbi:hypothetical protein [Microbulbifer sp. TRSA005]|uniref:hypothetical protein n=1 Tax=Microbulbifer sp. TRSA005 TaxID=3243383 RepID=UPI00403943B2